MMHASIARRSGVAAVAAGLLFAAALVGDAVASGDAITEPQTLELVTTACSTNDDDPETQCRIYPLRDSDGRLSGDLVRFRVPARDLDGNRVGSGSLVCSSAKGTGNLCTLVLTLRAVGDIEAGTIVATGTSLPPSAITGGSGAYQNVGGEIEGEEASDGFHLLVHLIP
jgi:hypothetical protein